MDKILSENKDILKKLTNIDKEIETLTKKEEEIVQRRTFEEKIRQLECTIEEKGAKISDLVQRVN